MVSRTGMSSHPPRTAYQNDGNPDPPAARRCVSQRSYGSHPSPTMVLDVVRLDNRRLLPVSGQPVHHPRNTVAVLEEKLRHRGEERAVDPSHPTMMPQIGA